MRTTLYLLGKIVAIAQPRSTLQRVSRSNPRTREREYKDRYITILWQYMYHGELVWDITYIEVHILKLIRQQKFHD